MNEKLKDALGYALAAGVIGLAMYVAARELTKPSTVIVEPTEAGGWTITERRV
jgi:hypothetical protein